MLFRSPLLAKTLLDPVICSEQGLLEAVDVPVLVSIPRVLTDEISAALRGRLVLNVTVSLVSVVVLVATTAIYH